MVGQNRFGALRRSKLRFVGAVYRSEECRFIGCRKLPKSAGGVEGNDVAPHSKTKKGVAKIDGPDSQ